MDQQRYIYEQVWDRTFWGYHGPKLEAVLGLLEGLSPHTILDVGCGDGEISRVMNGHMDGVVIGIDISRSLIKVASKRLENLIIGDVERWLPFRFQVFDLCTGLDVIEHVVDTDGFLAGLYNVLKPGGYLILVTPNLASLVERLLLLFGFQPQNVEVSRVAKFGSFSKTPPVGHFRGFTWPALRDMLEYYKFKVVDFRVTTYYSGMLKVMDSMAGRVRKTLGSLFVVLCEKCQP
jgi:ubiquinone/menaquinone biosynthesis C-methylase UbiE